MFVVQLDFIGLTEQENPGQGQSKGEDPLTDGMVEVLGTQSTICKLGARQGQGGENSEQTSKEKLKRLREKFCSINPLCILHVSKQTHGHVALCGGSLTAVRCSAVCERSRAPADEAFSWGERGTDLFARCAASAHEARWEPARGGGGRSRWQTDRRDRRARADLLLTRQTEPEWKLSREKHAASRTLRGSRKVGQINSIRKLTARIKVPKPFHLSQVQRPFAVTLESLELFQTDH